MRAIVCTTATGSWPMAVSPESMSASVPSNTALATSLTSARVGAVDVIIDSSIWVAVMTGTPASTQARMTCFCTWGTSSSGRSMPRSPRATITASATPRIELRLSTAGSVSILATIIGGSSPGGAANQLDVERRPHERDGHELDAGGDDHLEQLEVVGGGRGEADPLGRHVHPGPADEAPTREHRRVHPVVVHTVDPEGDRPVAQHHPVALHRTFDQLGVVDGDHAGRAVAFALHEADLRTGAEVDAVAREGPRADLRPREVGEHADGATDGLRRGADRADPVEVLVDGAVAEVQAEHVDAGRDERPEQLR